MHSNGNLYYYPEFNARTQGLKFSNELYHNLTRKIAWESVFRIRLSSGFTQLECFGNVQIKAKTQDLVLAPTMDSDRIIAYEFEKANDTAAQADQSGRLQRISKRFLFVQSALLYSTSDGQRRIRSHSIAISISQIINEVYDYMDIVATSCFLARKALNMASKFNNVEECKQGVIKAVNNLAKGQLRAARLQRGEQFTFSDTMQELIMYTLGVIKSPTIVLPQIMNPVDTVDKIVYQRYLINVMSPDEVLGMFSPQIISVSNRDLND